MAVVEIATHGEMMCCRTTVGKEGRDAIVCDAACVGRRQAFHRVETDVRVCDAWFLLRVQR
jgi:hypothetical protein